MKRHSRREFLRAAGLGAAGLALGRQLPAGGAGIEDKPMANRPNLIFLFGDQLGYGRCGYAGDGKARTPRLDGLAKAGVSFRQCVANTPVCAAFRASLLTGKYTTTTGMVINELRMRTDHECFGHVLTRAGYRTGYIGKWHLYANELGNHADPRNSFTPPGPHRLGFDGYWAAYGFHHGYFGAYYHTDTPEKISYGPDIYEPDGQTDLAIGFLKEAAKAGGAGRADKGSGDGGAVRTPFALFVSYGTPHDPWTPKNVPPKYLELFGGVEFPNPPNYKNENDPYADAWGRLRPAEHKALSDWRRCYYAMAANLDWNVGRLLDAVDALGLAESTLVVFTSDHGEMFGAHGRRAKNIFYEEAARIPFLVRWPGRIAPAGTSDACLSTVDMMPTVLGLLGLPVPKAAEGMDLSHCALGKAGPEPQAAFLQNTGACAAWEDGHEWRALRDKRYTYAIYRADRKELLFDNVADPWQMKDLSSDDSHKETLQRFRGILAEKMKSLDDTFEACTWYRDNWTKDRIILRGARG